MARLFRQRYTKTTPDGRKVTQQSRKWYVEYRDGQGVRRRVPGYTAKQATQQLASELEKRAAREQSGLTDKYAEHRKRPLSEHLADWRTALLAKGNTEAYVHMSVSRVRRVLSDCRFTFVSDLSASRVLTCLADCRSNGLSVVSSNHHLQAVKAFARWLVRDQRIPESPLAHLSKLNERTDRRHDRRALSNGELVTLLDTARNGATRFRMSGPDRARLYQLAVETGLRASELRSLTWGSFDLYGCPPTVTVRAAYSKHRHDDTLPMRPATAAMLALWRDESDAMAPDPVFATMPGKGHIAEMLRMDLCDANIPYGNDAGRVADFHALRHTFITNLVRGGVHPKVAQQLTRHSTITLTMDRYSHTIVADLAAPGPGPTTEAFCRVAREPPVYHTAAGKLGVAMQS